MFRWDAKTGITVGIWVAYLTFLFMLTDSLVKVMESSGWIVSFLIYLLANPIYLVFVYGVWELGKKRGRTPWKRIIASALVLIGGDLAAFPRLSITSPLIDGSPISANFGAITMRLLENWVPHTVSYFLTYWMIPLVCVVFALESLGYTDFWRTVKK